MGVQQIERPAGRNAGAVTSSPAAQRRRKRTGAPAQGWIRGYGSQANHRSSLLGSWFCWRLAHMHVQRSHPQPPPTHATDKNWARPSSRSRRCRAQAPANTGPANKKNSSPHRARQRVRAACGRAAGRGMVRSPAPSVAAASLLRQWQSSAAGRTAWARYALAGACVATFSRAASSCSSLASRPTSLPASRRSVRADAA